MADKMDDIVVVDIALDIVVADNIVVDMEADDIVVVVVVIVCLLRVLMLWWIWMLLLIIYVCRILPDILISAGIL